MKKYVSTIKNLNSTLLLPARSSALEAYDLVVKEMVLDDDIPDEVFLEFDKAWERHEGKRFSFYRGRTGTEGSTTCWPYQVEVEIEQVEEVCDWPCSCAECMEEEADSSVPHDWACTCSKCTEKEAEERLAEAGILAGQAEEDKPRSRGWHFWEPEGGQVLPCDCNCDCPKCMKAEEPTGTVQLVGQWGPPLGELID